MTQGCQYTRNGKYHLLVTRKPERQLYRHSCLWCITYLQSEFTSNWVSSQQDRTDSLGNKGLECLDPRVVRTRGTCRTRRGSPLNSASFAKNFVTVEQDGNSVAQLRCATCSGRGDTGAMPFSTLVPLWLLSSAFPISTELLLAALVRRHLSATNKHFTPSFCLSAFHPAASSCMEKKRELSTALGHTHTGSQNPNLCMQWVYESQQARVAVEKVCIQSHQFFASLELASDQLVFTFLLEVNNQHTHMQPFKLEVCRFLSMDNMLTHSPHFPNSQQMYLLHVLM